MAPARRLALPPNVAAALDELKAALVHIYGERLSGVYLYGSYARGDFHADSDVDVLVVLAGEVNSGQQISYMNAIVSPISLEHHVLIAVYPISDEWLETRRDPFLENVRREAIAV